MGVKVSVIVPVYNAEAFIEESANMILNQTLTEIEAIFVDDGSSDSSLLILKSLEAKDSRVKVLHQENINAGAARNLGLQYATGEYLSFLDADDLFDETMLEKAYNAASGSDIIVYGADNYLMDTGAYEPIEDAITDSENIFCRYKGWTWDKLFKSEFIKENNIVFQEQRTSNDLLFVYSALVRTNDIKVFPEVLVHRRVNNSNSISSTREKSWQCCFTALYALRAQLIKWDLFDAREQDFMNYVLELTLWNIYSLRQPEKDMFIYMCKTYWYDQLGVTKHDESYFYDKEKYDWYKEIMNYYFDDSILEKGIVESGALINELNHEKEALINSKSYKLGRILTAPLRKVRDVFGGQNE